MEVILLIMLKSIVLQVMEVEGLYIFTVLDLPLRVDLMEEMGDEVEMFIYEEATRCGLCFI
jgi:hypothetical protein